MNVKRTSIQTRVISMLLVLCMVFGMVPVTALEVFAATTTKTLDVSADLTAGTLAVGETTAGDDNYFTLICGSSTKVTEKSYSFSDGYSATQYLTLNGKVTVSNGTVSRAIKFVTTEAATVKVWWVSGGDGREIGIFTSDSSTAVVATSVGSTKNDLYVSELTLSDAGTYYLGGSGGNNLICKVEVTTGSGDSGSTETTAATTAATTTPSTGGSGYVHNFTANGTESDFYSITGSTATNKGSVTYDSKTLTTCLKMESSTNVSFTAPSAGTLTLVFGGNVSASGMAVKIDGTSVEIDSTEVLTVNVAAGSHTVTKGDAINLYYMVYTPGESHTHSYTSSVTKEATCGEAGVRTYTCSCGDSYTEAIDATGNHNYVLTTHAPTCTAEGYTEHTCSVCGDTFNDTYTSKLAHNYVDGKCNVCGAADPNYSAGIALTTWWSDFYGNYQITETAKTWNFTATTAASASALWDTIGAVFFHSSNGARDGSNLLDELTVRGDSFAVSQEFPDWNSTGQHAIGGKQSPADWDAWVQQNHNGAPVSITAQLVNSGKNLAVSITVNGVTNVYSVPVDSSNTSPIYMSLTGANVTITEPVETTGTSFTDSKVLNHTNKYEQTADTATCVDAGKKTFTCSCGDAYEADSAATGEHNYVDGTCSVCGKAEVTNTVTGNVTVTFSGSTGSEFKVASGNMVNGASYILSNSSNVGRAAYWSGSAWATGSLGRTDKTSNYTVTSSDKYTLFTWESTGTNTGYFKTEDGSYIYYDSDKGNFLVGSEQTEFTVDLSAGTIVGASKYMKIESSSISDNSSKQTSMQLLTPVSSASGGSTKDYAVTLTVTPAANELGVKETVTLSAAVSAVDGTVGSKTVTWNSSNESVATVNSEGVVTAVGVGTATITATLTDVTIDNGTASDVELAAQAAVTVVDKSWTDEWTTAQTNTVALTNSGSVTFTLSGTVPANAWGHLDNVKLYKEGSSTPIWTEDFDDFSTAGWNLTALNYVSSNQNAVNNKTGKLDLWLSETEAKAASASYTVTGLEAGNYYFTYDIIGDSTLTAAATAVANQSKEYEHNFATDGTTIESADSGIFTTTTNTTTSHGSGTVTVDGESMTFSTTALKINSDGKFVITANESGKIYLVYSSKTSGAGITVTDKDGNKTTYGTDDAKSLEVVEIDAVAGQTYTVTRYNSESALHYVKYVTTGEGVDKTVTSVELNQTSVTVDEGAETVDSSMISGLEMTITYSDGTTETIPQSKLTVDYTVKSNSNGKYIDVAYKVDGSTVAQSTIAVTERAAASGSTMQVYKLDTDGVDAGTAYIIVAQSDDGTYHALSHDGNTEVDVVVTLSEDGKIVNISASDATNALWTLDYYDSDKDSYFGKNGSTYLRTGSSTVVGSDKKEVTITHKGNGIYVMNMGGKELVVSDSGDWARGSENLTNVVGLYTLTEVSASSVTVSNNPTLQLGTYNSEKLIPTVTYNGTQITSGYTIAWSTNNSVVQVAADGTVTAMGVGEAIITGTVTYPDGTLAYVDVPVTVNQPTLYLGEGITMYVGDNGVFIPDVFVNANVQEYELEWIVDNQEAVTVDSKGNITAVAAGAANVTVKLARVKINDQWKTVDGNFSDSVTVTVVQDTVTVGKLNTDTLTVAAGDDGTVAAADIQAALDTVLLNLTWASGKVEEKDVTFSMTADEIAAAFAADSSLTSVSVPVTYTDASGYTFTGTVAVNKLSKEAASADGVIYSGDAEYVLDTDGVDNGEEYLIVWDKDGTYYALVNPDTGNDGSKGSAQKVTVSGNKATISTEYADLAEWTFTGKATTNGHDGFTVYNNNRYMRTDNNSFLSGASNAKPVYVYDQGSGKYSIALTVDTGDTNDEDLKTRELIYDGSWQRDGDSDTTREPVLLFKKVVNSSETQSVNFEVLLDAVPEADGSYLIGTGNQIPVESIIAQVAGVDAESYTVEWTVSNSDGISANDEYITGKKAGTYTVTATLTKVNGVTPYDNATNTPGIDVTFDIVVKDVEVTQDLQNNVINIPLGSEPDFSNVKLLLDYSIGTDRWVNASGLVFDIAGAVDKNPSIVDANGKFVPGKFTVDVYFNGTKLDEKVTVTVGDDLWDYRDNATSFPGYPDAGAVRMDKTAEGINWYNTGVAQIELNAAGISTKDAVDVVLIVDVSNSMAWTDHWFETYDSDATPQDWNKIPYDEDGNADAGQIDKLDQAMTAASNFADILLSGYISGSEKNNTISFVTFAGNDRDKGGNTDDIDSVMTVFTGVEQASKAKKSFENTKFTKVERGEMNEKGNYPVTYTLQIADENGDTIAKDTNRGNTNYDWAFQQANSAVDELKKNYKSEYGKDYDESGRELHVVFMTDGAPSHYNGRNFAGSDEDGRYEKYSGDKSDWLAFIQNPNADATTLYSKITDMHIVGYDLDHGGFGSHSWTEAELGTVLYGIVDSQYLPYTLASNTDKLNQFFEELGKSLAYAGTNAYVTDTIGDAFELHTSGVNNGSAVVETPIQYVSRRLVVASDIGTTLKINGVDTLIEKKHLGEYVDGTETVIEEITFGSGKTAYSSFYDETDIWDDSTNIIKGKYVTVDLNAKTVTWQIGDITEYEYALTYYAYLTGSMESTRGKGMYDTNESATLTYIDVNGDIAERKYPVPQMPWGSGSVTVHFYLVNEDGEYANEAGETFDNVANRLFLTNTANYPLNYNGTIAVGGKDGTTTSDGVSVLNAFVDAGLTEGSNAGMYELFDETIQVTVKSSSGGSGNYTENSDKTGTNSKGESLQTLSLTLTEVMDMMNDGTYTIVNINIPVIKTGRSMTDRPLSHEIIVLDYGKAIQQSIFTGNETVITGYGYSMEVYGFQPYDPNFSTNWYLEKDKGEFGEELNVGENYTLEGIGTFTIVDKAKGEIRFTPSAIMTGVESVFAVVKLTKLDGEGNATNQNYYLYNPVHIVPATTVYYETDFASGVFGLNGNWSNDATDIRVQDADPDINRKDDETLSVPHGDDLYGNDSNYNTGHGMSADSAMIAVGEGPTKTKATFTFTGTGVDIISKTGVNEGTIRARVYNSNGTLVKTVSVMNKGLTELNQIPVINLRNLAYGTYTVEIGVFAPVTYTGSMAGLSRGASFIFDAIRVYGTCDGGEDKEFAMAEYKLDGEANAQVEEIRDLILTAGEFASGVTSGIIYIDGKGEQTVSDYDLVGPNNELYLLSGSAIAFKLQVASNAPATVALAAKSVDGNGAALKVTVVDGSTSTVVINSQAINSATAQYYDLLKGISGSVFSDGAIVIIENTGSGKLSLTDLKVAFSGEGSAIEIISNKEVEKITLAVKDASCKIESAEFIGDDFRVMRTATMTVVTSANVDSLKLCDVNGNVVWSSATCIETGDTKVWTVKMRPILLGDQTYTVVAFNADGEQGENVSNTINVKN